MRAVRRVVSAVVALALLAVSVIILVEVVVAALDRPPWLIEEGAAREELATRAWDDPMVILVWGILIVLGVILLVVALVAGRQRSVSMDSGTEGASLSVRRRSLERYLAGVATAQPGVRRARASVKPASIKVRADTTRLDAQDVRERVQQALSDRVQSLRLTPAPTISVSVQSSRESR